MTIDEFMHTLPFVYTHIGLISIAVFIFASIIILLFNMEDVFDLGDFVWEALVSAFVGLVISVFITLILLFLTPITSSQIDYARGTQTKVTGTKSYDLSGATSNGFTDQETQGSVFYVSGSSTDTTSYRFVIKDNSGNYQIRTIKDMFGNVNKNDIYINQSKGNKPHLQVDTHKYADKRMADLIDNNSDYSSTWKTYTFYVPDNSITSTFSFK